jgi:hypothetical protein
MTCKLKDRKRKRKEKEVKYCNDKVKREEKKSMRK